LSSASRTAVALVLSGAFAVAGAAFAQPAAQVIKIDLSEYKYSPMEIDLKAGQSYVFHITNSGSKGHDLSAKAFFATVALAPGSAAKVKDGDVDLDQGESVDVTLTPQKPGAYEMHCTHFMHAMLGMKGRIVVN
jgi:plastocyanin